MRKPNAVELDVISLLGCVSYWPHQPGEMGVLGGKEFWGKGVCTEALKAYFT